MRKTLLAVAAAAALSPGQAHADFIWYIVSPAAKTKCEAYTPNENPGEFFAAMHGSNNVRGYAERLPAHIATGEVLIITVTALGREHRFYYTDNREACLAIMPIVAERLEAERRR